MIKPNHWKVQVWIFCKTSKQKPWFLLLKTCPERGEFWQPVTGSVEKDEELQTAALREASEETGLNFLGFPQNLDREFEFDAPNYSSGSKHVLETSFCLEALCDTKDGELTLPTVHVDPHEHTAYQWIDSPQKILTMLRFHSNAMCFESLLKKLAKE